MAYYVNTEFEKRMRKVVKRHNRLATSGVVHKMMPDGLVVAKPRIYNPRFPWLGLALLIAAVFLFKGYVHFALGAEDYAARTDVLLGGTILEQAGGLAMFAEPVTLFISNVFTTLMG
ncbi:MAG: hypothetical protein AAFP98_04400 [Pseudomonadota bacterium]